MRQVTYILARKLIKNNIKNRLSRTTYDRAILEIIKSYCAKLEIQYETILEKDRTQEVVFPRMLICYILRYNNKYTLRKIAQAFISHHTTIMHYIQTIENILNFKQHPDNKKVNELITLLTI